MDRQENKLRYAQEKYFQARRKKRSAKCALSTACRNEHVGYSQMHGTKLFRTFAYFSRQYDIAKRDYETLVRLELRTGRVPGTRMVWVPKPNGKFNLSPERKRDLDYPDNDVKESPVLDCYSLAYVKRLENQVSAQAFEIKSQRQTISELKSRIPTQRVLSYLEDEKEALYKQHRTAGIVGSAQKLHIMKLPPLNTSQVKMILASLKHEAGRLILLDRTGTLYQTVSVIKESTEKFESLIQTYDQDALHAFNAYKVASRHDYRRRL